MTSEFPKGTYAYFLTTEWPVVPRFIRGIPIEVRNLTPSGERITIRPK